MPPYTAAGATTWLPAPVKVQNTVLIAAIPEAKAWAASASVRAGAVRLAPLARPPWPSSAATAMANASAVGLSIRL